MISTQEYIKLQKQYDFCQKSKLSSDGIKACEKVIEYNKALIRRYPFLMPSDIWTYKILEGFDYTYSLMDSMPEGWRIAFGDQMLEELREELVRHAYLNDYRILQIKEKFGQLCWYTNAVPKDSKLFEIVQKYENMSLDYCIECGAPSTRMSTEWISPFCDECAHKLFDQEDNHYGKTFEDKYITKEQFLKILKEF